MNLGPDRIIYTPEDDIERQLKIAQLREYQNRPRREQQDFLERQRQFDVLRESENRRQALAEYEAAQRELESGRTATETERYHRAEETGSAEARGIERERIKATISDATEAHKAAMADTLARTLPNYVDRKGRVDPSYRLLSETMAEFGYPQANTALARIDAAKAKTLPAGITPEMLQRVKGGAAQRTGGPAPVPVLGGPQAREVVRQTIPDYLQKHRRGALGPIPGSALPTPTPTPRVRRPTLSGVVDPLTGQPVSIPGVTE